MRYTILLLLASLTACEYSQTSYAPAQPVATYPDASISYNAYPLRYAPMDSNRAEIVFDSLLADWPTTFDISSHCTAQRSQWYVQWLRSVDSEPTRETLSGWMDAESEGDPSGFCFGYNITATNN